MNRQCGSQWNRWDLHFHTPSSYDYADKSVTDEELVDGLRAASIRVVAVTDHHVIDVARIKNLQRIGGEDLTVLPGIELRDDHGSHPIHYICIFQEDCNLDHVWTTLQGRLGLTPTGIALKGGDDSVYVPIGSGADLAHELGGMVTIHAGSKSNSIENIKNKEQFQMRIKYDITAKFVDALEIGQIKDIDRYHNIVFPNTVIDSPLLICSDNHNIKSYETKAGLWLCAEPTFRGLLMVTREPRDRVFIGARPPSLVLKQANPEALWRGIGRSST